MEERERERERQKERRGNKKWRVRPTRVVFNGRAESFPLNNSISRRNKEREREKKRNWKKRNQRPNTHTHTHTHTQNIVEKKIISISQRCRMKRPGPTRHTHTLTHLHTPCVNNTKESSVNVYDCIVIMI